MPRLSSFLLLLLLLLAVACVLTSANGNNNNHHDDDDDDSDGHHNPVVCTDDTWRQYVGNTNPLPRNPRRRCYDPPNPPSGNTIEKRIITEYAYNTLVARNYDGYAFFSSPGTWLKVPQLGITVDGQTAVIGYFALGDLDVTDIVLFWSIDILDIIQDGLKVAAQVSIFEFAPHFGGNFTTYNTWFFEFHPNRTIKSHTLYVDTYSVITKIGNAETNPAINCPLIQERCTGPYQQYTDVDDCIAFMNTKPDGSFNQPGIYDTKYCRGFHLLLTINRPEIHCPHTGKNSEVCAGTPPF